MEKNCDVSVKITAVKAKLSLPIVVYAASTVSKRSLAHEYGHVTICTNRYSKAESIAEQAAHQVLGRVFEGKGNDFDSACRSAVERAVEEMSSAYRADTVDFVNAASVVYDRLEATKHMPIDAQIKAAETEAGRKRRQAFAAKTLTH